MKESLERRRLRHKRYKTKHPERLKQSQCVANYKYRQKHPDWEKIHQRKQTLRKLGWTLQTYKAKFEEQQGICAICGDEQIRHNQYGVCPLDADHNHLTMNRRGLLCCRCNAGLGQFRVDSKKSELLIKAIEYLAQYPK